MREWIGDGTGHGMRRSFRRHRIRFAPPAPTACRTGQCKIFRHVPNHTLPASDGFFMVIGPLLVTPRSDHCHTRDHRVPKLGKCRLGGIGLGRGGPPLAVELAKQFDTVGFDLKAARIAELRARRDSTQEVSPDGLAAATRLSFRLSTPMSTAHRPAQTDTLTRLLRNSTILDTRRRPL